MAERQIIKPQPGPQEEFLKTSADIAIYGGSAGGGKSWAILLEAMRHRAVKGFSGLIFRKNMTQVTAPGSIWEQTGKLYPQAGGKPRLSPAPCWTFPSGAKITFGHLETENTVYNWMGAELAMLGFDELTHFSQAQFFYMLSRNRSTCGVRPYVRATCNPDADSWVASFISWWIYQGTGKPIEERAGKLRWFVRAQDAFVWADHPSELASLYPDIPAKSVTFIPATLDDNPALTEQDPGYKANLMALSTVERERLLNGNWKIRPAAGLYFKREWCPFLDAEPAGIKWARYWDMAATPKTDSNDPDWTIGVKLGQDSEGRYYVGDVRRLRGAPREVEDAITNTAAADGKAVRIGLPQDPGQAGKALAAYYVRKLDGYSVTVTIESGDKITRFGPTSSQARAGNIVIIRGSWNEEFLSSLEGFPEAKHDDDADALGGAHRMFENRTDGMIEHLRRQLEAQGRLPKQQE